MRRVMTGVAGILLVGVGALLVVGWLRPSAHSATTEGRYAVPQQEAWDTLTSFGSWGAWYPEVSSVKDLPDSAGTRRILISGEWGDVPTRLTLWEPPHRLRTDMDEGTFSGSWTWEITPLPDGTLVTVTETGEVRSILFRALMVFNDNAATMLAFHRAFADRLGVQAEPAVVRK